MEKIKVAFFAEMLKENFDGAVRTMYQIIERIPQNKFEFLFITGVPPDGKFDHEVFLMPTVTIPFNKTYQVVIPSFAKNKMQKRLDEFQPDIIHIATPSALGNMARKYGLENHLPILTIYHTNFLSYIDFYLRKIPFLAKPIHRLIGKYYKTFYDTCDMVLVPTNEMIKDLKAHQHRVEHMEIWRRGIDRQLFHPSKKDEIYIKNIVKNDDPNILFSSRLVWEKNLEIMIDLYDAIQSEGLKFNLIIAGDGVAREELEEKMPNAFFLGMIPHEELSVLYASADVFFFPSITETYGNVIIEAMASGLPCVLANGGSSPDLVHHGENGFLCEPMDAKDYLEKIKMVLMSKRIQEQFYNNGLGFVQPLDWDSLVDTYFERLEELSGVGRMEYL